ncbi:MAG TPA: NAD(P)H-binding protein [Micromonosporaceae bacterium]|jgi:putative NADH-flavin reductase
MKLTVFGATGRIGEQAVRQALGAGHTITAVVREQSRLDIDHPSLDVVRVAGLADPEPLVPAVAGRDAVLSAVGPRRRSDTAVASTATRGILGALEAAGVRRFAAVSAVPVGPVPPGESWFNRRILLPAITRLLREVYADLATMEDEIRHSDTDWTIIRPPNLVNRPLTNTYRTVIGGNVPRGKSIGRADVAHAMLALLDDAATIRQAVGVAV